MTSSQKLNTVLAFLVFGTFFAGVFYITKDAVDYRVLMPPKLAEYMQLDSGTEKQYSEMPEHQPSRQDTPQTGTVLYDVPFAAQAPFAEWEDPRQQDGCEEIAAFMAIKWARGESMSLTEARDTIIAVSDWEQANYGSYHDTSARDTVDRIFKGYFGYNNVEVAYDISIEDIKRELYAGNLVIVPTNGKALNNPNFTSGGPERHMFPIIGYDPSAREFIVNENGTRRGENYRYHEVTLQSALRDYASGYKEPIPPRRTAMIVVRK